METEQINNLSLKASELFVNGQYTEALKIYYTILATDLNNSSYNYNVGVICSFLNDIELAVAFYKKAIRLDEKNIRAINNLASLYVHRIKDFNIAAEYLDYVIKIAPNDPEAYNTYGNICLYKNDFEKAKLYLKKAIMLDENYFGNHYDLARAFIGLEQKTDAKKELKKCTKLNPNYKPAFELLDSL